MNVYIVSRLIQPPFSKGSLNLPLPLSLPLFARSVVWKISCLRAGSKKEKGKAPQHSGHTGWAGVWWDVCPIWIPLATCVKCRPFSHVEPHIEHTRSGLDIPEWRKVSYRQDSVLTREGSKFWAPFPIELWFLLLFKSLNQLLLLDTHCWLHRSLLIFFYFRKISPTEFPLFFPIDSVCWLGHKVSVR